MLPLAQILEFGIRSCGGGGGCFAGETKIATPGGEKAISELKVGESVTSMDPETGELTESKVEDIYSRTVPGYYKVTVEMPDGTEKVLKVTGEHPLYVKRGAEETTTAATTTSTTRLEKIQNTVLSLFSRLKERVLDLL